MRVSAKTEYACIAMMELAARYGSGEPVRIKKIADEHDIPSRFLVQILLQLKGAGYVNSTRGASGGYELVVAPEQVTLGQVMTVIEGREESLPAAFADRSPAAQVLHGFWNEVTQIERDLIDGITFADLLERTASRSENMYYI